jgi:hypothetical protein
MASDLSLASSGRRFAPPSAVPLSLDADARSFVADEAQSMLSRLDRVRPFALHETMVPAAAVSVRAQSAIEHYLARGRRELRRRIREFLAWLDGSDGRRSTPEAAHRRLAFLRLRFNAVLTHFDVFAIVMTQRSEHETGVWLSGLDVVARDALSLPGHQYDVPPVVCYLDRGFGAAIRRARTRLPGGGETPVAIVRIPRERMIGTGVASSLVHEVGHQAAALLDLVAPIRRRLQAMRDADPMHRDAWRLWARWISEIVADFWSVALVGVGAPLGLMGVLDLPRAFVFRSPSDDPHPMPFVRVLLSCVMGDALYPDPQWRRLAGIWTSYYPPRASGGALGRLLAMLDRTMPALVDIIARHAPPLLGGESLADAMPLESRGVEQLRRLYREWTAAPSGWRGASPTLAFAVLSQARADGRLSPEGEARLLGELLAFWALRTTIDAREAAAVSAPPSQPRRPPLRRRHHRLSPETQPLVPGVA